jgi:hypothetical protein
MSGCVAQLIDNAAPLIATEVNRERLDAFDQAVDRSHWFAGVAAHDRCDQHRSAIRKRQGIVA